MVEGQLQPDRADADLPREPGARSASEIRRVVVLGGARSVWDEYAAARALIGQHAVIAVNDAGVHYPGPILCWATLHPEKLGGWRRHRGGAPPFYAASPWRHDDDGGIDFQREDRWGGSSGLYAVQIAIEIFDFHKIVLCGVPIDGAAGHIRGIDWWDWHADYRRGWLRARPHIADRVRSLSGWTAENFGVPSPQWLSAPALEFKPWPRRNSPI